MRKFLAALFSVALGAAVFFFLRWGCAEGFELRDQWVPAAYAFSIAGLLLFSLLALGARNEQAALEAAGLAFFFQLAALSTGILRQPVHAAAAGELLLDATLPAFVLAFLLKSGSGTLGRYLRLPALLVCAGIPPLPGFFARIDALSALVHAELPWMALWCGLSQVAVTAALLRIVFDEYLKDRRAQTVGA